MAKINLGVIIKAQGIKGEVKVKVNTNDLNRFLHYKKFWVDKEEINVVKSRVDHQYAYVLFEGVSDMNTAETFRGRELFVDEKDLPKLQKGEYYILDLMKASLCFEDGVVFAKVTDVLTSTINTVIMAKGEKSYSTPLLKDVVIDYDSDNNILTLNEKRFKEVSLIED